MGERGEQGSAEEVTLRPKETVVLVAEDEPLVRNLIQLMLVKEGYAVLSASDGQEALEILEQFKDPVHLLLTDVRPVSIAECKFAADSRGQV